LVAGYYANAIGHRAYGRNGLKYGHRGKTNLNDFDDGKDCSGYSNYGHTLLRMA
jgi:hypothetical protein